MNWYRLDKEAVLAELNSPESGLSGAEATKRLEEYGRNRLSEEEKINRFKILLHQFKSPLIYILMIAAAAAGLLSEYIDMGVILFAILLNAVIGYMQEYKSEESVRALRKMVTPRARVLRDGMEKEINSEELVPGDIVLLASGAKVPADIRLLAVNELKVDEAMLTGESFPAEKSTYPLQEEHLTPGDQKNMVFMGTIVASGRGKGVVVGTGGETVLGRIATDVKEIGTVRAPIQERIDSFARAIGLVVLSASVLLFGSGVMTGETIKDMFLVAVAAAVATIPEGLPVVATIAMAVGVSRMAAQNAIIRKLPAVETLGSTRVIATDKTGTLTKNEMTVKLAYDGRDVYEFTGSGYEPEGKLLVQEAPTGELGENLAWLFRTGVLCNESDIYAEDGIYKADGDPTEAALLVSAVKAGLDLQRERAEFTQAAIIPFESERGYMATLNVHDGRKYVLVKGAPERVLEMCGSSASGGPSFREDALRVSKDFAAQGLRVLAFAWKEAAPELEDLTHREAESGLVFAGLQGMMDPPRPEAVDAIKECRKAGIRVIMITGDHAETALAIARVMGIVEDGAEVLTGRELEAMDDRELSEKIKEVSVYARVSPEHKLRITRQLKEQGDIVAVTGDGVNDAPALKAANIGVAMGRSGTDVAREASDMVLTDDNFASIFNAVKEGRIVFDNLRKVTFFLIPTGIAAIMSIAGTMLLGVPIPFVPAQLLWINIVTNGLQDVALAFEPGEKGVINRPPRDPDEGLMSPLLVQRTVFVALLISAGVIYNYLGSLEAGETLEKARSVAVTTMVFFQFFQAINSRSEYQSIFRMNPLGNPFLFYGMLAAFFAQLAVLYVPALQWIFRTEPITPKEWLSILAVSVTVIALVEIDKLIRRRRAGD